MRISWMEKALSSALVGVLIVDEYNYTRSRYDPLCTKSPASAGQEDPDGREQYWDSSKKYGHGQA
jgi:hypothetical protein